MKTPIIPDPDITLRELSPVTRLVHEAIEVGVQEARAFFDQLDEDVNPFLAPDLVRYYAGLHIDEKISEVEALTREPLANNGLYLHFRSYKLRILKSDEGDVPVPGPSRTRQAFYQQRLTGWDAVVGEDESSPLNLLIIWDVNRRYVFLGMTLVCPKDGSTSRESVEKHWEREIPLATSTPRPTESHPEETADLVVEDVDDLPLTRNEAPKTGTENADD